jgi:Arc/MetJ-type ribon-helix-helix transcriptional regulator
MVQLEDGQKEKIENCIKVSYPKLKNTSEVLREALRKFLDKGSNQSGQSPVGM